MFSNLRKRLEDSLDAVEQLATQQMQPRGSFDGGPPPSAAPSPDRRRVERSATTIDKSTPAGGSTAQLAESALSSLRKSIVVQKALAASPSGNENGARTSSRDASPSRRELRELTPNTSRAPAARAMTLEDRLKAKFAIGDVSGNTSAAATRTPSPAPPAHATPEEPSIPQPSSSSQPSDPISIPLPDTPILEPADVLSTSETTAKAKEAPQPDAPVDVPSPSVDADPLSRSRTYIINSRPSTPPAAAPPASSDPSSIALPASPPQNVHVPRPSMDTLLQAPILTPDAVNITTPPLDIGNLDTDLDPDKLRERLKLVEQRFSDVSKSFKRLQAEKVAADKILKEMTPLEGMVDAEGLREHLRNTALKNEMSTEEIKRLNGQVRQHDERVEELRDIHKLETKSQSELIESLRKRVTEAEVLLTATSQTTSSIEAASSAKQATIDQLKNDLGKARDQVKDEEEKRGKAMTLLKTVRTKSLKTEKEKEELTKERDDMRLERDAARGETMGLRGDIDRMRSERERDVAALRGQFEKEVASIRERVEREAATRKGQFELEVITLKAAHAKELNVKSSRITQLESTIRTLTQEKDALFDLSQLRQAEIESAQSHLESLTNQNNELQYQLREANDRIAILNEEMYDNSAASASNSKRPGLGDYPNLRSQDSSTSTSTSSYFPSSPSHESPAELARLLSEAEGKYESRLSELRDKMRTMEKERNDSEEEWSRNMSERGREIERLKRLMGERERGFEEKAGAWKESEARIAALERGTLELRIQREEMAKAGEVLKKELEHAREAEANIKEDKHEATARVNTLERQVEEYKGREAQLRSNNKTLREELRKVQSSAALLERQRNPGVGYWAGANASSSRIFGTPSSEVPPSLMMNGNGALSPRRTASPALSEAPGTPTNARRTSLSSSNSNAGGDDEAVNLEYLRNVILQFLENEKMRPDLVRVLSIILRFTPQETRRLLAKVG